MPEIPPLQQALIQTQILERAQEAARRQGDLQQQTFAASLGRRLEEEERRVGEGEESEDEAAGRGRDPEGEEPAEGEADRRPGDDRHPRRVRETSGERFGGTDGEEGPGATAGPAEEDRGRHVDTRA